MVVGVNWLMLCPEYSRYVFWAHYCSSCTLRSFFTFCKLSWPGKPMTPLWLLLSLPVIIVKVAESLNRDIGTVSKWCDLWMMQLCACKTKTMIVSSHVKHNESPVTHINHWRNCAEGLRWPCYIGSDIWFQDDFWEASSLGFQRSFSNTSSLEAVLAGFLWYVAPREMLMGFVLPVLEYCSAV